MKTDHWLIHQIRFKKYELKGILVATLLIMLILNLNYFYSPKPEQPFDLENYLKQHEVCIDSILHIEVDIKPEPSKKFNRKLFTSISVNTCTIEDLEKAGIKSKTAARWIKFRHSIGKFKSIDQIKKIYGIDTSLVNYNVDSFLFHPIKKPAKSNFISPKHKQTKKFSFDPNTLSIDSFSLLGFSKYTIQNIDKFRSKKGRFYSTLDFKKIYGIDTFLINKLVDSIVIKKKNRTTKKINLVDINAANEEEFASLSGIGPSFSNRIVKFRNKLGGFTTIEQIAEVYGISDSLFQSLKPYLTLKNNAIKTVNINTVNFESLSNHPYINFKEAKRLLKFRIQHGPFDKPADLKSFKGMDEQNLKKLMPYLAFNN